MHKSIKDLLTKDNQLRSDAIDILKDLEIPDDRIPLERQKNEILKTISLIDSGITKNEAIATVKQSQRSDLAVSASTEIVSPENNVDQSILNVAISGLQQRTQQGLLETISQVMETVPPSIAGSVQRSLCDSLEEPAFVADTNAKIKAMLAEKYGL
jgi:hypothetical protein